VGAKEKMNSMGQPVPEWPVADVERAQQHYRDALGFEIGWLYPGKEIGSVSRGDVAICFRKRKPPFEPSVHWVFAEDVDAYVPGTAVVRCEHRGSSGKKALGMTAVHGKGSGRKSLLFPP